MRESAALTRAVLYPTSFADHEHILHDPQVQEFLGIALTRGVEEAVKRVPVRPRGNIRAADGKVMELVGIVVRPDEPVYRTNAIGKVYVHVRPGGKDALSADTIRLIARLPGGHESKIALRPDPSASDPTNPFEQSFVGEIKVGPKAGTGKLIATVAIAGGPPRVVEQPSGSLRARAG